MTSELRTKIKSLLLVGSFVLSPVISAADKHAYDPNNAGKTTEQDLINTAMEFGTKMIDKALIERMEKLTGHKPHPFLTRGLFAFHKDLERILDLYEQGKPFYIYTGRGPSSDSMHLGHLIPFMFVSWLQKVFDVPVVIMLSDDEKCIVKDFERDKSFHFTTENAKDIIAVGFEPDKTFIFSNWLFQNQDTHQVNLEIMKRVTFNQLKGAFGVNESTNAAMLTYIGNQMALAAGPSVPNVLGANASEIPCLVPCALDQEVYFRIARDVFPKAGYISPALIESRFMPALTGAGTKMTASTKDSAIYLNDTFDVLAQKIKTYAFSGGQSSKDDQIALGADLEADVSFQYLRIFLHDDARLAQIAHLYGPGQLASGEKRMMTSDVKKVLTEVLWGTMAKHQARRAAVDEEVLRKFFNSSAERFAPWRDKFDLPHPAKVSEYPWEQVTAR